MSEAAGPSSLLVGGTVDRATATLFWRVELGRTIAARAAADGYVTFVQERYADILGEAVAPTPGPSAGGPPLKRAKTEAAVKGKGKARVDAMEEGDVVEVEGPADAAEDGDGPGKV